MMRRAFCRILSFLQYFSGAGGGVLWGRRVREAATSLRGRVRSAVYRYPRGDSSVRAIRDRGALIRVRAS